MILCMCKYPKVTQKVFRLKPATVWQEYDDTWTNRNSCEFFIWGIIILLKLRRISWLNIAKFLVSWLGKNITKYSWNRKSQVISISANLSQRARTSKFSDIWFSNPEIDTVSVCLLSNPHEIPEIWNLS